MSLRQYARHRGLALSAVQKAIQTGRISTLPDGQIESEAADADWERNTNAYTSAKSVEDDAATVGAGQYAKARAVREHYQARLSKMEFEEKSRKLVPMEDVIAFESK